MKKTLALLCFVINFNSFSQLSIWVDNRYGFKMAGSYDQYGYYNNSNQNSTSGKPVKYCFGNGYQGGIGVGYRIKNNICAELGVGYLFGAKTKTTSHYYVTSLYNSEAFATTEIKAKMLRILLGFSCSGSGKITPIVRMGLIIGTGNIILNSTVVNTSTVTTYTSSVPFNSITSETRDQTRKFYDGISLGFHSALGIHCRLSKNIGVSLCFDVIIQQFNPQKATITRSTLDGNDQLNSMTTSQKETEFKKEFAQSAAILDPSSPTIAQKFSIPLSSFGPLLTIVYTFGNKDGPVIQ